MSVARHIVSPLCLFTQTALPLHSSHSALNVHNALGNCCFPLSLKSHRLTRLSSSVLLFIFKGLNQDKYPQVSFNRLTALCAPQRCPGNLLSWHKFVPVAWKSRKNVDEYEREARVLVVDQTEAYSRDRLASISSSLHQRLGGEVLWNHTITVNITTLSKHNFTELDRWERDRRKGLSFTADTRKDRYVHHSTTASVLWENMFTQWPMYKLTFSLFYRWLRSRYIGVNLGWGYYSRAPKQYSSC